MSFFVCFLYTFKASEKIVSKFVEEMEVDETFDIGQSKRRSCSGCLGKNKEDAISVRDKVCEEAA